MWLWSAVLDRNFLPVCLVSSLAGGSCLVGAKKYAIQKNEMLRSAVRPSAWDESLRSLQGSYEPASWRILPEPFRDWSL